MSTRTLTKDDLAVISREQARQDAQLLRALRKIARSGEIGRDYGETLLVNGLIHVVGPNAVNSYNHFSLTAKGTAELDRLEFAMSLMS